MNMGIIAEDDSDVGVMREITSKLLRPFNVGFKRFVGNGCGKLRRKCAAWATVLTQQGCSWIVVIHDLDFNDEDQLRTELTNALNAATHRPSIVLIPRREIEAWLLYDGAAIAKAFGANKSPKLPGNPEALPDPKKQLRTLVKKSFGKTYIHTIHNQIIARFIKVSLLQKSKSFSPHIAFSANVRAALGG